jgi:hypothetical protein
MQDRSPPTRQIFLLRTAGPYSQKRTLGHDQIMSALAPRADIAESDWHVRFVADIVACRRRRKTAPHNLCGMPQAFAS